MAFNRPRVSVVPNFREWEILYGRALTGQSSVDSHLVKVRSATLLLLWHEYRELNPDGYAYTQCCEHYRRFTATLNPTMRLTHVAGEKTFLDFAGLTLAIYEGPGVMFVAQVFVAAPGASNLLYVESLASQDLASFVGANERAFHYYGGVSQLQVPDNLKSAVTTPDRYEPMPERHLHRVLRSLQHRGLADARAQTPRQGQGRRPGRRVLDPGPAARSALRVAG